MRKVIALLIVVVLVAALFVWLQFPGGSQTTTGAVHAATGTPVAEGSEASAATAESVAEALATYSAPHDDPDDYVWDRSSVIPIALDGDSIADAAGVTVSGSTATITAAGTYSLSGALADGQIIVDSNDEGIVRLILNGVDIHSSTSAPLYVKDAEKALIVLADGTQNLLSDSSAYVLESADSDEPNATLFSAADLTLSGAGALVVTANYNDGITSKDGLLIDSGTISVQAADDGIRGKDYLVIRDGAVNVEAQGDGLKSDNAEDAAKGYITIENGVINSTAAGDAAAAESNVLVAEGTLTLTAGGGSGAFVGADVSAKGIKGAASVIIAGGSLTIDAADDAIHSNGSITIDGGTLDIATGDDGMHADSTLKINAGAIRISKSYEGLESAVITINGGEVRVVSSDDGINVAGGNDGSGMMGGMGPGGRPGMQPGQGVFAYSGDYYLYINGGYIVVDANGDGLDANGAIEMTGGVVLVNGPTSSGNGALDYDGGFKISGGLIVAAGSSGMAQAPDASSSQDSMLVNFSTAQAAGALVHIESSSGEDVLTFAPTKQYQSILLSSPELAQGETYTVYTGGAAAGSAQDGLYEDAVYTAGTPNTSLTLSSVVTTAGVAAGRGRRR